jgi:ribosomal protein S18 acetylase RimI-like enzyme
MSPRELDLAAVQELLAERRDELVAVWPDLRGRGIGARLHDELLSGLDSPTAVLSTQVDNEAALGLYERRAWEIVLSEIDFGASATAYCVLGIALAQ